MAWHRPGNQPLYEPIMVYFNDAYMRHSALMNQNTYIVIEENPDGKCHLQNGVYYVEASVYWICAIISLS